METFIAIALIAGVYLWLCADRRKKEDVALARQLQGMDISGIHELQHFVMKGHKIITRDGVKYLVFKHNNARIYPALAKEFEEFRTKMIDRLKTIQSEDDKPLGCTNKYVRDTLNNLETCYTGGEQCSLSA